MASVFVVVDCKKRRPVLATPSARKAGKLMRTVKSGLRLEIWNEDVKAAIAYPKNLRDLDPYIQLEKQYIGRKQKRAEDRNRYRRSKR